MRSQIGGPKAMRPVNFRRLVGKLHSVAKQASFNVAFKRDLKGFRRDFGRFWEAKTKSIVARCFCNVFFEGVFASILDGFFEARHLKNQ